MREGKSFAGQSGSGRLVQKVCREMVVAKAPIYAMIKKRKNKEIAVIDRRISMKKFSYTIKDPEGIHARPAGLLVKQAAQYTSSVKISKGNNLADAGRIFSVMGLAAKQGETVTVVVEGPDEEQAAEQIRKFFEQNL